MKFRLNSYDTPYHVEVSEKVDWFVLLTTFAMFSSVIVVFWLVDQIETTDYLAYLIRAGYLVLMFLASWISYQTEKQKRENLTELFNDVVDELRRVNGQVDYMHDQQRLYEIIKRFSNEHFKRNDEAISSVKLNIEKIQAMIDAGGLGAENEKELDRIKTDLKLAVHLFYESYAPVLDDL